ncbi:hypothetical protein QL285_038441 [Trifolium repens]|nr:hypothetical protein QL285_038441 [Trifolium repens]
MFVVAFQNGLKVAQFNEPLAQKPTESMQEIMIREEFYITGEESNTKKRSRDAKERGLDSRHGKCLTGAPRGDATNIFAPMNPRAMIATRRVGDHLTHTHHSIPKECTASTTYILQARLGDLPPRKPDKIRLGPNKDACHYHLANGHDTEDCYRPRDIIEDLVKTSHLDKYLERHSGKDENSSKKGMSRSPKKSYEGKEKAKDFSYHVTNTIA